MFIALAIISGGLTILSMILNAQLSKEIGIFRGAMINYVVGFGISIIVVLLLGRTEVGLLLSSGRIPLYAFIGGVIGVGVVAISNMVVPRIPVVYTTLIIFIGQILTGIIIDMIRLNTLSKTKIFGAILIIIGLYYNSKIPSRKES